MEKTEKWKDNGNVGPLSAIDIVALMVVVDLTKSTQRSHTTHSSVIYTHTSNAQ